MERHSNICDFYCNIAPLHLLQLLKGDTNLRVFVKIIVLYRHFLKILSHFKMTLWKFKEISNPKTFGSMACVEKLMSTIFRLQRFKGKMTDSNF